MTCAANSLPLSGRVWMSRTAESPLSESMRAIQGLRSPLMMTGMSSLRAARQSAMMATSTLTFLLISEGSSSIWIFFA